MNKINLEKYLYQLLNLSTFYRYSKIAFKNNEIRNEIKKNDIDSIKKTLISIEKIHVTDQLFEDVYRLKLEKNVDIHIDNGLKVLRQHIVVSSHTIFENFLCNLVRSYLNVFPNILKDREKSISFREIVDLKDNDSVLKYVIEKEVNDFSWISIEEKKDYLTKRLKILNPKDLWEINGEYLLKEIDNKRHSIIHDENPVEISEEELFKYTYYFERIIFGLSTYAKVYQGVDFIWQNISEKIPGKDKPSLK
jgi:hypothetical protein